MEGFNWFTGAVIPYFNFFLFCGMLYFLSRNVIKSSLKQKKEDFLQLAQAAKNAMLEAQKQQQAINDKLMNFDNEMKTIQSQSIMMAEQEAENIVEHARQTARALEEQAQNTIRQLEQDAFERLKTMLLEQVATDVQSQIKKLESRELFNQSLSQLKLVVPEVLK